MGAWKRWAVGGVMGVAMLMSGAPLGAQNRPSFVLGLEAGPSLSKYSGPTIKAPGYVWGGFVGAFGEYRASPVVSFPFGVNWVQKGGKGNTLADAPFELRTSYIEIPVMVNFTAPESGAGRIGVYAGLSAGFQLGCDSKAESGDVPCGETDVFDTTPETVEWSVPFGFEYDREVASGHLVGVDIRYTYGLSDLFTADDAELKSRTWQFLVSWGFPVVR